MLQFAAGIIFIPGYNFKGKRQRERVNQCHGLIPCLIFFREENLYVE
jgi:hypothetical protein